MINKTGQTKRLLKLLNSNDCCPECPPISGAEGNTVECRDDGVYVPVSLPSQDGNTGKFLSTDGNNPFWTQFSQNGTINVKDYGAVGDGVIDDSAAFTAALVAAGTTKTVVVPDGNYMINTTIVLDGQALVGLGNHVNLLTTNTTGLYYDGTTVFNVVNLKNNCYLNKINFSGTGKNASWIRTQPFPIQNAIKISGDKNIVDTCIIHDMKGAGIFMFDEVFDSFHDNRITNITIKDCTVGYMNYYYGQYVIFSHSLISYCRMGVVEYGNNNNMADVHVNWCDAGGLFNNSVGDDHGFITGCSFNHSNSIEFNNLQHGYTITGTQFWYCDIICAEADKVIFSNCAFGNMVFNVSATVAPKTTLVTGGYATGTITYNQTGTGNLQRVGVVTPLNSYYDIYGPTRFNSLFNLPVTTAPASPVDGDMWRQDNTNTGLKVHVNGVTKTISLV